MPSFGDTPLKPQNGLERAGWQFLQTGLLLGKVFADHAPGRRVRAHVGNLVQPFPELSIEVGEVTEAAAEEEILSDIAERSFHFTLCFRTISLAGFRDVTVVAGELDQRAIVDDVTGLGILMTEHGFHPVVEDLGRRPAERLERGRVAAQYRRHVLMHHEPRPDHSAVAEHEREQPDHPLNAGLVGEHGTKLGEVDLRLPARRRLEPHLERRGCNWPDLAQKIGQNRVAALIAHGGEFAMKPAPAQFGNRIKPLAQSKRRVADLLACSDALPPIL